MKKSLSSLLLSLLILFTGTTMLFSNGNQDDSTGEGDVPVLEVWWAAGNQRKGITVDNPYVQRTVEDIGIAWERPTVPWDGGAEYGEKLKLRLAAGNPPDIMRLPNSGFSIAELIDGGVAADLTELLPKYAPTLYGQISDKMWNIAKSESPNGDKIYYIPSLRESKTHGAFIRKDWLDRVGMEVPVTQTDFFNVMRAFKEQDANGNGDPNDEIPTTGRGPGRWWDHLITPYGAAMVEGFPTWDFYDGKIQYSAVQPEMKNAIIALRDAYAEGLIDPEVLINKPQTWTGKITGDQAGIFFHMPIYIFTRLTETYKDFPEAEWVWMPPYVVEGVDAKWSTGYAASKNTNENVIINNTDGEETIINALKYLEWMQQSEIIVENLWGIEGINYTVVNGEKVKRTDNMEEQNIYEANAPTVTNTDYWYTRNELNILALEDKKDQERALASLNKIFDVAEIIEVPGTILPMSIYDGYPDISTHQLYFEMMANIMVGEWDIDAFDDFVEKWYATGGAEVTNRAQKAAEVIGY